MTRTLICTLFLAIVALASCNRKPSAAPHEGAAVYFWRTTFSLDSTERKFLQQHQVKRIYLRFFDVVMRDGKPMPNATLKVNDSLPQGIDLVPTIFITEPCMKSDLNGIATLLADRVAQMCQTLDLPEPKEIQIDCDWTRSSQQPYFSFLSELHKLLQSRGMRLSATIRLHQLSMPAPPVDYGVLMVYNTGDARRINGHNPILDLRDVKPYLRHAASYSLPLCAAYPVYGWQLLYDNQGFKAVLHEENLNNSNVYRQLDDNTWLVIAARDLPTMSDDASQLTWVLPGDTVRTWRPTAQQVLQVSQALQRQRHSINRQVILYSLDTKNINPYTSNDYEKMFNP